MHKLKHLNIEKQQSMLASRTAQNPPPTFDYNKTWFGKILTNTWTDISSFFVPRNTKSFWKQRGAISTFDQHKDPRGLTAKGIEVKSNPVPRQEYFDSGLSVDDFDQIVSRKPVAKPKQIVGVMREKVCFSLPNGGSTCVQRNVSHGTKEWNESFKKTYPIEWARNWDWERARATSIPVDVPWRGDSNHLTVNKDYTRRRFNCSDSVSSLGLRTLHSKPKPSLSQRLEASVPVRCGRHTHVDAVSSRKMALSSIEVIKPNPQSAIESSAFENLEFINDR